MKYNATGVRNGYIPHSSASGHTKGHLLATTLRQKGSRGVSSSPSCLTNQWSPIYWCSTSYCAWNRPWRIRHHHCQATSKWHKVFSIQSLNQSHTTPLSHLVKRQGATKVVQHHMSRSDYGWAWNEALLLVEVVVCYVSLDDGHDVSPPYSPAIYTVRTL